MILSCASTRTFLTVCLYCFVLNHCDRPLNDQSKCEPPKSKHKDEPDSCVVPKRDKTFLEVYNCEFIKPPKPDRCARAMKQIFKPNYVLSHYVHYSTVTKDIARLRKEYGPNEVSIWLSIYL